MKGTTKFYIALVGSILLYVILNIRGWFATQEGWELFLTELMNVGIVLLTIFIFMWEWISGMERDNHTIKYDKFKWNKWYEFSLIWIIYLTISNFNKFLNKIL